MIKISFPFHDQLNQFSFNMAAPLRFPFCINEISYLWEVGCNGNIVLYISNSTSSSSKMIDLENSDIRTYLLNKVTDVSKQICVEFEKIGFGYEKLKDLDHIAFLEIDTLTLGKIANVFADWLTLDGATVQIGSAVSVGASDAVMAMLQKTATITGNIALEENCGYIGLSDLKSVRYLSIGELDPKILRDIDMMISVFKQFKNIPAALIKEIRINQNEFIDNDMLSVTFSVQTSANNISYVIYQNTANILIETTANISGTAHQLNHGIAHIDILTDAETES